MSPSETQLVPAASPAPASEADLPFRFQKSSRILIVAVFFGAFAWLWWNCDFNRDINFLSHRGSAEWIVYPLPPSAHIQTVTHVDGAFRRRFALSAIPAHAIVSWGAFREASFSVNGQAIPAVAPKNWKQNSELDVAKLLRIGTNEISVVVSNTFAPPALALALNAGDLSLRTDEQWEASLLGSEWRAAQRASSPPRIGKGNFLFGGDNLPESVRARSSWLVEELVLAIFFVALTSWWTRRARKRGGEEAARKSAIRFAIAGAVLLCLVLLHNFGLLTPLTGFDAEAHIAYIKYIRDKGALPMANEGWEMFQPPLYYLISSGLLGALNFATGTLKAVFALRCFALCVGALHVFLIFSSLRLLFPNDWRKPLAGAALAAVLPAHFYLLHYVTNETLAAMFVSASLYFCLRILRDEKISTRLCVALGICLGAALLSKSSALLAVPFVFGAIVARVFVLSRTEQQTAGGPSLAVGARAFAVVLVCFLVVCGWHYARVWARFGNPLIGNWDPALGRQWWQGPGYHTSAYYFAFGESLVTPMFSSFKSFWDGIYSSFWGDGLCGGRTDFVSRTPWNYDIMTIGYVLALLPTALIVLGAILALKKCWQQPRIEWLVLLGLTFATGFSVLYMTTKLTNYGQAKAFYGLATLLPICAFVAMGLDWILQKAKAIRICVLIGLTLWAINCVGAFWVRGDSVQLHLANGLNAETAGQSSDAQREFETILQRDPHNAQARLGLARLASKAGHTDEALGILKKLVDENPSDAEARGQLALELATHNETPAAIEQAEEAVKLAPEDAIIYNTLAAAFLQNGQIEESITANRRAIGLFPSTKESHFNLGLALMKLKQSREAITHFEAVLQMDSQSAPAHYFLGGALYEQGRRKEALEHLSLAVQLEPENKNWRAARDRLAREAQ